MGKLATKALSIMRILAYTENYAHKTVTFITNELNCLNNEHKLLLAYSTRINSDLYNLPHMICIPYNYNRFINKLRWWLEKLKWFYWCANAKFKHDLNKAISEFKPDVIHCHFAIDYLKVAANLNKENDHIPVLVSMYGFDVTEKTRNKAILKEYRKYFKKKNVHSIAVSSSLSGISNELIDPVNKTIVLHSGIDFKRFNRKPYQLDESEFVFIQIASYLQKKGHFHTLRSFKKFVQQDTRFKYRFIIIGFGPLENEVKQQVIDLDLQDHVQILEPVSQEGMIEWCSKANCFVQMSITADNGDQEGLPNALIEAMALELPILSTRHAGIPDIVIDGVNGILCDEKNEEQYLKAMKEIVNWGLCPQNRTRVVEKFGMDTHMKRLNSIYGDICKKG